MSSPIIALKKFKDITVGDIISVDGIQYLIYDNYFCGFAYNLMNISNDANATLSMTDTEIENFLDIHATLERQSCIEKNLKLFDTEVVMSKDGKIDDIIKVVKCYYTLPNVTLYYHPKYGKMYNVNDVCSIPITSIEGQTNIKEALHYSDILTSKETIELCSHLDIKDCAILID
jgi:hypothetical protein